MTISTYMLIGGVRAYDTDEQLRAGSPTILDGVEIQWGRQSVVDQPISGTLRFSLRQWITGDTGQRTLFQFLQPGVTIQVRATESTTGRDVLVWAGNIVNATITRAGDRVLAGSVNASDSSAMLSKINVGDDPWLEEPAYARLQHILAAAGLKIRDLRPSTGSTTDWQWNLTGDMDDTIKAPMVAFRDVDSQPPLDLIQQVATSVGGITWVTADDSGPSIWIEDPSRRKGLHQFVVDPVTRQVTIGQLDLALSDVNRWTADDIDASSLSWDQDPTQAVDVVAVTWQQAAGRDDQGNPAYNPATVEVADSLSDQGIQPMTVDTQLIDDADARQLAIRWLAQAQTSEWMSSGLSIDTAILDRPPTVVSDADRLSRVMDLLDVQVRIGYRLTLTELPAWSPTGTEQSCYIEGGTYTWTGGRWQMQLTATSNAIGGGASWNQFPPNLQMKDFAGLRGRDMWGAAAPNLSSAAVGSTLPMLIKG